LSKEQKKATESGSKNWKNKKVIVIVVILLSGILVGTLLYTRYFLKPKFNIFDLEKTGGSVKFNLQNVGNVDAHNVKIKVNGTWIPTFKMNATSVEHGYMVSPEQIATVFYGTIESAEEWFVLAKRVVPSIVGGETDRTTFLKLAVVENGVWRYLTDSEVTILIDAFENPRVYYTFGETTIDILKKREIKTVNIILPQISNLYEVVITCDEGTTLHFSVEVS